MNNKVLIYLHGFNGSPNSEIAKQIRSEINKYKNQIKFIAPDISGLQINEILNTIKKLIQINNNKQIILTGTSLGGYFATQVFLQIYKNCKNKLILINPCLNPEKYIDDMMGEHTNDLTQKSVIITKEIKAQIQKMQISAIPNQTQILLLTQNDDERIDYKDAIKLLPNAKKIICSKGGHAFTNLNTVIPDLINFCELN